jgi:hypothetical protein
VVQTVVFGPISAELNRASRIGVLDIPYFAANSVSISGCLGNICSSRMSSLIRSYATCASDPRLLPDLLPTSGSMLS